VVGTVSVRAMNPKARQVWARTRAFDAQHPEALDSLLALALFTGAAVSGASGDGDRPADGTFFLLLAIGSLPYAMRRRAPLTVLVLASLPVLALIELRYTSAVIGSGLFLAAYTVATWRTPRCLVAAVGWVTVLLTTLAVTSPDALPPGELLTNAALFVGAFGLGRSTRVRHTNSALLKERAELAERARSEAARLAVSEERLRIAQELHDVIGHSLGVIALQAQVGAHVIDVDPAEAKAALVAVSSTSRTALAEIRRILGAMHDGAADSYHPAPGLGSVGDLAAQLTAAGLPVEVRTIGTPDQVPTALDLTAYRLVQEALTNVAKHAGRTQATVTVRYEPRALDLEIFDDGPTDRTPTRLASPLSANASPGHGQLGMRERVAVWGGSLEAGPRPEGGYAVRAHLPFGEGR
jgi:signal transduction histidine kinase